MVLLKRVLDALAFIFTIFLVIYGFAKGYDIIEFFIYDLYFIVIIITQLLTLFGKENL